MGNGCGHLVKKAMFNTLFKFKLNGQWLLQLTERSVPTPEALALNPVVGQFVKQKVRPIYKLMNFFVDHSGSWRQVPLLR